MGYYTRYEVSVMDEFADDKLVADMATMDLQQLVAQEVEGGWMPFGDSVKWYKHEKDMERLSKRYPKATFILYGEGEDFPDVWRKYFRNGESYKIDAKITWDEFDASKLAQPTTPRSGVIHIP